MNSENKCPNSGYLVKTGKETEIQENENDFQEGDLLGAYKLLSEDEDVPEGFSGCYLRVNRPSISNRLKGLEAEVEGLKMVNQQLIQDLYASKFTFTVVEISVFLQKLVIRKYASIVPEGLKIGEIDRFYSLTTEQKNAMREANNADLWTLFQQVQDVISGPFDALRRTRNSEAHPCDLEDLESPLKMLALVLPESRTKKVSQAFEIWEKMEKIPRLDKLLEEAKRLQ